MWWGGCMTSSEEAAAFWGRTLAASCFSSPLPPLSLKTYHTHATSATLGSPRNRKSVALFILVLLIVVGCGWASCVVLCEWWYEVMAGGEERRREIAAAFKSRSQSNTQTVSVQSTHFLSPRLSLQHTG